MEKLETALGTKLTPLTKKLLDKYAKETNKTSEEALEEIVKSHLTRLERDMKAFGQPVPVQVELSSLFLDFLKDYCMFFACKDSVEDFCRKLIYKGLEDLRDDLTSFVDDNKHLLDSDTWYWKYHTVAAAVFSRSHPDDEDETEDRDR